MSTLIALIQREVRRLLKNPMYGFCMIGFPLIVMVFFTTLMGDGQPTNMPVGVVDADNTATTRKLTRMLDAFQSSKVVAHYNSVEQARKAMQQNEIYAFLYFPKGTTEQLLASRQPQVSFYYSMTCLTAGSLLFRDLKTISTLGAAAVGKSVLTAKGATDKQAQALLQPIVIDLHPLSNPWTNYNIYLSTMLIPGVLMLFIFLITPYSIGTELKFGDSKSWLHMAGGNMALALAGKILPQTLVSLCDVCLHGVCVRHPAFSLSGRHPAYPASGCLGCSGSTGVWYLHVFHHALHAHEHERVLAVGRAQLLYGGLCLSRFSNGQSTTGIVVAISAAPLLYALPSHRVQRLFADERVVSPDSIACLCPASSAHPAPAETLYAGIQIPALAHWDTA